LGSTGTSKEEDQAAAASAYYQSSMGTAEPSYQTSTGQSFQQPREEEGNLGKGLSYVRQMDPSLMKRNSRIYAWIISLRSREPGPIENVWSEKLIDGRDVRIDRRMISQN